MKGLEVVAALKGILNTTTLRELSTEDEVEVETATPEPALALCACATQSSVLACRCEPVGGSMTQEPRHFVAALAVPPNMRFRARTESSAADLDVTKRCRGIALANYMRDGVRGGRNWGLGTVLAMPEEDL